MQQLEIAATRLEEKISTTAMELGKQIESEKGEARSVFRKLQSEMQDMSRQVLQLASARDARGSTRCRRGKSGDTRGSTQRLLRNMLIQKVGIVRARSIPELLGFVCVCVWSAA